MRKTAVILLVLLATAATANAQSQSWQYSVNVQNNTGQTATGFDLGLLENASVVSGFPAPTSAAINGAIRRTITITSTRNQRLRPRHHPQRTSRFPWKRHVLLHHGS